MSESEGVLYVRIATKDNSAAGYCDQYSKSLEANTKDKDSHE